MIGSLQVDIYLFDFIFLTLWVFNNSINNKSFKQIYWGKTNDFEFCTIQHSE